jgi:hypothetical protein
MTHTPRTSVVIAGLTIAAGLLAGGAPAEAQDRAWARELEASIRAQANAARDAARQLAWRANDRAWVRDMLRDFDLQLRGVSLQLRGGRRFDGRGEEATEAFSRTARLGRNGTFDLQNIAGDIVITGGGGDAVRIDATKRVRARDAAEARSRLPELRIEVMERADRVEVRTEYPRRTRDFYGAVDFTVTVPSGAGVTVQSVSGNIRDTNVDGELRMQSVSGNLVTSDVKGLARVRSVSGNIEVSKAEGGDITGGTMSGDLVLTGLKSKGVELQSVSGDMRLSDVEVDRANVRSVTGDVDYRGRLARSGRYELQTHSGDLRVTPRDAGFELEAGTFSGDVRSDYELKLDGGNASAQPQRTGNLRGRAAGRVGRGRGIGQRLRGSSGSGGAMLVLQSFSGDIEITK